MDADQVFRDMVTAARAAVEGDWEELRDFVEPQLKTLARVAARIEARKLAGTIDEEKARILIGAHRNALGAVALAAEGMARISLEKAINAALAVLRGAVGSAIGWPLL